VSPFHKYDTLIFIIPHALSFWKEITGDSLFSLHHIFQLGSPLLQIISFLLPKALQQSSSQGFGALLSFHLRKKSKLNNNYIFNDRLILLYWIWLKNHLASVREYKSCYKLFPKYSRGRGKDESLQMHRWVNRGLWDKPTETLGFLEDGQEDKKRVKHQRRSSNFSPCSQHHKQVFWLWTRAFKAVLI